MVGTRGANIDDAPALEAAPQRSFVRPRAAAKPRVNPVDRADVSVVIVNYQTTTELTQCLLSLRSSLRGLAGEVFVVDNASTDFSPDIVNATLPSATVLRNDTNLGFARAANRALRVADGRYVLLLNPDTIVAPDTLQAMVTFMDARPMVGCATPRLVLPNGRLDLACRRSFPTPLRSLYRMTLLSRMFPRSRRFGQYNLTYLDEHTEAEVDSPSGAFMMVRSEVTDQVGLLDESYFLYGEDLDWAFRIKQAGWQVMYTPVTTVQHTKRASSRQSRSASIGHFYDAMRIFYRGHYESRQPRPVNWLIYAAINAREALELVAAHLTKRGARA